jgi:hypothetical protein
MIYFILYVVSVLIAIPIVGRFFNENIGHSYTSLSPVTLGITYGITWPLFVVLLVSLILWDRRPGTGIIRRYVIGE